MVLKMVNGFRYYRAHTAGDLKHGSISETHF